MKTKSWWRSKTLWFNALGGLAAVFGADGSLGHVFAPAEVGAALAIGNGLLRLVTSRGLVR